MHDIFISYSHADEFAARQIAERLRSEGLSVFFDSQGIVAGSDWTDNLNRELESADTVLALLSSHTARSKWVQEEIQQALAREKRVIPILLDQHAKENWLWPLLGTRQSLELNLDSKDAGTQLDHLARDLRQSRRNLQAEIAPQDMQATSSSAPSSQRNATWHIAAASAAIGAIAAWIAQWLLSK